MNRLLALVLIILIGANVFYAWHQNKNARPTNTELDADISAIEIEIKEAEAAALQYQKGILMMAKIRIETLKTTRAMLQQKRASLIRGIDLSYTVDGAKRAAPDPTRLSEIQRDLEAQTGQTKLIEQQAQGSGGMIRLMAQLQFMVEQMKTSMLQLEYYTAKYDIPFTRAINEAASEQREQLGKIVADPGAL